MSKSTHAKEIIAKYLKDLDFELRSAPDKVREEFVVTIRGHISEGRLALATDDDTEVRELLQRIGDPKELAAEVLVTQDISGPAPRTQSALWAALAVLVVVALLAGFVLRATYDPPIRSMISFSRVLDSSGNVVKALQNGNVAGGTEPQVWLEPSNTFSVEIIVVLQNSGDFGVTLNAVQPPTSGPSLLAYTVFFSGGGNHYWGSLGKFHPISIAGHASVSIGIRYSERCVAGPNTYIAVRSLPVAISFLGEHHSELVGIQPFHILLRPSC